MKVIDKAVSFQVLCPFCRAKLEFEASDLKTVETEKGPRDGVIHCPVCEGEFAVKNEQGVFFQDVYSLYPAQPVENQDKN